jgi:hypothetical protein
MVEGGAIVNVARCVVAQSQLDGLNACGNGTEAEASDTLFQGTTSAVWL